MNVYLYNTSVTADSGCLDTNVLMTIYRCENCSWSSAEVDFALASLVINEAAGNPARNCTVNVGGTNAAPGAQRQTDAAALETAGWTVTYTAP